MVVYPYLSPSLSLLGFDSVDFFDTGSDAPTGETDHRKTDERFALVNQIQPFLSLTAILVHFTVSSFSVLSSSPNIFSKDTGKPRTLWDFRRHPPSGNIATFCAGNPLSLRLRISSYHPLCSKKYNNLSVTRSGPTDDVPEFLVGTSDSVQSFERFLKLLILDWLDSVSSDEFFYFFRFENAGWDVPSRDERFPDGHVMSVFRRAKPLPLTEKDCQL
jgi:hypothetical protein